MGPFHGHANRPLRLTVKSVLQTARNKEGRPGGKSSAKGSAVIEPTDPCKILPTGPRRLPR